MVFPVFVNLTGRLCVVIGGGPVAERRVSALARHGGTIRLVAPEATPALEAMAQMGKLTWVRAAYEPAHLDYAFLVFAATDRPEVNAAVADEARERNILVCRTDEPGDGDFITPAVIERGELTIAVATGGNSPTLTAVVKARLGSEFGPEWAAWTQLFGRIRGDIQKIGAEAARRSVVERILNDSKIQESITRADLDAAEKGALACISSLPA